jgi:hypothetical protein
LNSEKDQEWNFCSHSLSTIQKAPTNAKNPGKTSDHPGHNNAFTSMGSAGDDRGTNLEMKLMLKKMEELEQMSKMTNQKVLSEVYSQTSSIQ